MPWWPNLTILHKSSTTEILFFQIAEPSWGTVLGNPQINSKSSIDVIPPAMITFSTVPGMQNIISLSWFLGMPARCPYLCWKVRLKVLTPFLLSSIIFLITSYPVFTVLPCVKISFFSFIDNSTIILFSIISLGSSFSNYKLLLMIALGTDKVLR